MYFMFLFSIFIIFLCTFTIVINLITRRGLKPKSLKKWMILDIVALGIFSYYIEPSMTSDLYRHFISVDKLRANGFSANIYNELIGAKTLLFFISKLPDNHFLPVISTIISYCLGSWIIYDYYKINRCRYSIAVLSFIFMISVVDFLTVTSGIRNAMAMAFIAIGLYFKFFKSKKIIFYLPFFLIAMTIHSVSFLVVAVCLIFDFIKNKKFNFIIVFWGLFFEKLIYLMNLLGLVFEAKKLSNYFYGDSTTNVKVLISRIILIFILLVVTLVIRNNKRKKELDNIQMNYIEFYKIYIYVILGGFFINTIFIGRLLFLIGFMSIPLFDVISKKFSKNNKLLFYIILSSFIIFSLVFIFYSCFKGIQFIV